jgi:hypothetical protein
VIVSTVAAATITRLGDRPARWQSLVRRGMLFSECESIEHWQLPAGAELTVTAAHGLEEAILVLAGSIEVAVDGAESTAGQGQAVLLAAGLDGTVRAGAAAAEILTVRSLCARASRRLPPRVPELPEATRSWR